MASFSIFLTYAVAFAGTLPAFVTSAVLLVYAASVRSRRSPLTVPLVRASVTSSASAQSWRPSAMIASTGSFGEDVPLPSASLPHFFQPASSKPAIPEGPVSAALSVFQPEYASICAARTEGRSTVHAPAACLSHGTNESSTRAVASASSAAGVRAGSSSSAPGSFPATVRKTTEPTRTVRPGRARSVKGPGRRRFRAGFRASSCSDTVGASPGSDTIGASSGSDTECSGSRAGCSGSGAGTARSPVATSWKRATRAVGTRLPAGRYGSAARKSGAAEAAPRDRAGTTAPYAEA
ncbi:hypothetical protein GA0115246_1125123, partial [Streptomyces sp. SolWspMP-sol7th]